MTTSRENANPNVLPYKIDLRGLTIVQVLWLLSAKGFTVSAATTDMWKSNPDKRRGEKEPDPTVYIVWINDGEAKKLTVIQTSDREQTLSPGLDLHCFTSPENYVANAVQWCAIRTLNIMR